MDKARRRRPALAAFLATLAMALGFTAIPAEAAPPPKVDYVALGDSYTAGTGAGAAFKPTGATCWRSSPGYVDVVGKTGRVNLVANAACHGAVLSSLSPSYDGITPTVQEQLQLLVATGKLSAGTELVSITAGANDLGFANILGICATYPESVCADAVAVATSAASLTALKTALIQTYVAIQSVAPNAKIAVLGYPVLFDPASALAPIPAENQALINQGTLALNAAIAEAVQTANLFYGTNAQYIDVTALFAGHEVNSADPWLQLNLDYLLADYNFHPNRAGHQAYASALLGAVKPAQLVRS